MSGLVGSLFRNVTCTYDRPNALEKRAFRTADRDGQLPFFLAMVPRQRYGTFTINQTRKVSGFVTSQLTYTPVTRHRLNLRSTCLKKEAPGG